MKSLDYAKLKQDVIDALERGKSIVLATCSKNRVTAREVYYASDDLKVFFITSKAYNKYKQIEKNRNVALCLGNIQVEGIASILGHPSLEENRDAINTCLNKSRSDFEPYLKYKNIVLIEVAIERIKLWRNNGREHLDVSKQEAYRIG